MPSPGTATARTMATAIATATATNIHYIHCIRHIRHIRHTLHTLHTYMHACVPESAVSNLIQIKPHALEIRILPPPPHHHTNKTPEVIIKIHFPREVFIKSLIQANGSLLGFNFLRAF